MRFSVDPMPGDSGFNEWHDAMRMVARLPGGIPDEFRRKVWPECQVNFNSILWCKPMITLWYLI